MAVVTQRAMTPDDICKIRWLSDPQISPDGQRVAFVVTTLSEETDEYQSAIWVAPCDSGEPRRFTTGQGRDTAPRWSPDGARLAFLSDRQRKRGAQLFVMPADGGEAMALTDMKRSVASPVWSPDGSQLAFLSRVGGWDEPESEEEKRKSKPARVIETMRYRSNGEGFTYDRPHQLFTVAATGGEPVQRTDGPYPVADPAWSPDGAWIAFASARHAERDYDNAADIFVLPAAGGVMRQLTNTAGPASAPAFSPDGATVAYVGDRRINEAGRNTRLFAVPFAGGTPDCLTPELDRSVAVFGAPVWSADGGSLLIGVPEQGNEAVYRVVLARTPAEQTAAVVLSGERQITALSACPATGALAFLASDPTHPAEIFLADADGANERPLTDLNGAWRAAVALSRPQHIRYQNDGVDLDCWVMPPFGAAPGRRYPTLLNIHGGPHAQYGNTFFDEFQVQAGAGYAVVYSNPRGSQGYGENFTRAVVGRWGDVDFADVMAGLDTALGACDYIDPERLGVLGGSYGGYLTSWTVGHTNRFQAACSERALNTFTSFFGTSDIGPWFAANESGALPWDDPQWYVAHSPLTYAPAIRTPLLIMHAENDLRCPIEQGEQLFMALKLLRRETRFIRFPDESHELSRSGRVRHRLQRFHYILEWFGKYLQYAPDAQSVGVGANR